MTSSRNIIRATLLCVAGFIVCLPSVHAQRLLGDVSNAVPDTLVLSPDGKRFAIVTVDPRDDSRRVIVDGKRMGKNYASIASGTPLFSQDGQHVAFVARAGRYCYVINDGVESDGYLMAPDGWPISSLVFSPNGKHLAFKARVDGRTMVVIDRQHLGPYEVHLDWDGNRLWGVWDFCFSPDGGHFAYRARDGSKMVLCTGKTIPAPPLPAPPKGEDKSAEPRLVVSPPGESIGSGTPIPLPGLAPAAFAYIAVGNGKEHIAVWNTKEVRLSEEYDAIVRTSLAVPPHNPRGVDFIARKDGKWVAVIAGKDGPPFDEISPIMYTAGGRSAYAARRDASVLLVVDGMAGNEFDGVRYPGTVFSPDGKHFAYAGRVNETSRVILDDQPQERYDHVDGSSLVFSPNGELLAYVAQQDKQFVVLDGKPGPRFDRVIALRFSPGGMRLGYAARNGLNHFLVIDDQQLGPFDAVSADSPAFSEDGKRVAYAAFKNGQWRVTLDDKTEPGCEGIVSRLTFTKQGLVYVGKFVDRGREVFATVANGQPGKLYDAIWMGEGGKLLLDPAQPEYFGRVGPIVYRDSLQFTNSAASEGK